MKAAMNKILIGTTKGDTTLVAISVALAGRLSFTSDGSGGF